MAVLTAAVDPSDPQDWHAEHNKLDRAVRAYEAVLEKNGGDDRREAMKAAFQEYARMSPLIRSRFFDE